MRRRRYIAFVLSAVLANACSPDVQPVPSDTMASPDRVTSVNHSLGTFVAPDGPGHFDEPAGSGRLKLCRSRDNSIRAAVSIPAGTNFSDVGVIDQPPEQPGGWWLLQVETMSAAALADGQACTTAEARVVPTEIPANYADMKSLTRFSLSDRRYFEILAQGDELERHPALLLLNATALTDFK